MERFKFIFIVALAIFFCIYASAQQYTPMTAAGYQMKRLKIDSTLHIPSFCGMPTIRNSTAKDGAIAMDTCNNKLYKWTNQAGWSEITGGGSTIDTTSLSNRINLKLNISDTSSMLSHYFNAVNYGLSKSGQTINVDSATLSNKYLRIVDTTNKWVSSVTKLNDSTIRVVKDGTTNDITLTPASTVTSATRLVTTVYNITGSTIPKGSVVYINGRHSSNLPTIALAQANNETNSYKTFALVENDIANNNSGIVIQAGNIGNLNLPTSSFTDGDLVYLSPSVAGGITTTKPTASNHICKLGSVTRAHPTFGQIEIKIENGWQMDELSDVKIANVPNDSTILQFSRVDSLWHDVSPTTAIGNRYIKPSDTASMLTNYAKTSAVNLKVNISDTASMLSKYLRKVDTVTLSNRIDLKSNLSQSSYTFLANNTNATANMSTQIFNDQGSQTYSGTITWNQTSPPSGTTNHTYRWTQVGKMVTLNIILVYGTASGVNQTTVIMSLPTGVPNPSVPSGLSATNGDMLFFGNGNFYPTSNSVPTTSGFAAIRGNAGGGYEVVVTRNASAGSVRYVNVTVQYWTN